MPCCIQCFSAACAIAVGLFFGSTVGLRADNPNPPPVATFSIVAYDPGTGDLGVAVASKFFGVGSVVPWAKAGVGAIATQSRANVTYGTEGLALLEAGDRPDEVVKALTAADPMRAHRQFGVVDAQGRAAAHTGAKCVEWAGQIVRENVSIQGNLLAGEKVVTAMAKAFDDSQGKEDTELAEWLMAALAAGQKAGGDRRGRQSAALLVVRKGGGFAGMNDRYIDLRVADHTKPIVELDRLLEIHKKFFSRARRAAPPKSGR